MLRKKVTPVDTDGPFIAHVDRMKPIHTIQPSPTDVPVQSEDINTHDAPPKRKPRRRRIRKTQPEFHEQNRYSFRKTVTLPEIL